MIMNRQHSPRVSSRSGITRVDLIAVLAGSFLVAMLFLPATRRGRTPARKLHCLNNIRQLGLANQNFAAQNGGKLPYLSASKLIKNGAEEEGELIQSWQVALLPALDAGSLLRAIRKNVVIKTGRATMSDAELIAVEVFTCPDDSDSFRKPGGLSYVVNAGFISQSLYHGDPDRKHIPGSLAWIGGPGEDNAIAVHAATGVFWQQTNVFESSLDDVSTGDGATTTLMLAENLQAGNWYDTDTAAIGFGFPVANSQGKVSYGAGRVFESEEKPLNTEFDHGALTTARGQDWRINADLKAKVGTLPRPSSNHTGGVNVIMCDGSGRFLNQNIDPHVYLKLLTSNGVSWGEGELKQSEW
jgi:hypothetical protein